MIIPDFITPNGAGELRSVNLMLLVSGYWLLVKRQKAKGIENKVKG